MEMEKLEGRCFIFMDYYSEICFKIDFYNKCHDKKANKVTLGYKVLQYFHQVISANGNAESIGAEIMLNNATGEYDIAKIKGLHVEICKAVPYIIDIEYDRVYDVIDEKIKERKNNDLILKLFFTKEEVRKIARIDYRVKEDMDKSLKDLKVWVKYDEYLKSIGESEDNL